MAKWSRAGAAGIVLVVTLSPLGFIELKKNEGLGQPKSYTQKAYADPYYGWKLPTICYGHTGSVKRGDVASLEQCEVFLKTDVAIHCKLVYDALIPHKIWLTQGEQDAYCSFAFNTGKFKETESIYGRLMKQDDWGACMGLLKYTYSNGQASIGLWNRRYTEYNSCISQLNYNRYGRR